MEAHTLDFARLHVVVPAYCEAKVVGDTVRALRNLYPHVIVVDDASTDDTVVQALRAGATVVRHPVNLGQGAALQTGFEFALERGAEFIATFDADGQHTATDLARMLPVLIEKDLDIVLASRFLGEEAIGLPWTRRLVIQAALVFTNLTSGLHLTDTHNGLRVMTAATARRLDIQQNRMAHASEILNRIARFRLKYQEVPATIRYSRYSLNKGQHIGASFRIVADLIFALLRK